MDNRFFQLPLSFDSVRLAADLAACEALHWVKHFNKNDYDGDWTGISLRSSNGDSTNITSPETDTYTNTPLLAVCAYFTEILDSLAFPKEAVRLLALAPGSIVKEHRDRGLSYKNGCFRLHIPITTDDGVDFIVDGCRLCMEIGQCWYADFDLPHSIQHAGTVRRIHLVIDGKRNDWTDALFGKAGYDFEVEKSKKEYDPVTKARMIEHLRMMDSDTARELIARLEGSNNNGSSTAETTHRLPNKSPMPPEEWIPTTMEYTDGRPAFRWSYLDGKRFTEPFFEDSLHLVKRHPFNTKPISCVTSADFTVETAASVDAVPPDVFIFHVSRCGSTLLAQLLSTDEKHIVLSEVPLLDDVLRLPYRLPDINSREAEEMLKAIVRLLGRKRSGIEQRLFIKTDSWHLFFYAALRRLFPHTPFILLYRHPAEVMRSHQKQRGTQAIPGMLESTLIGFDTSGFSPGDLDGYLGKLLERYFALMVDIARQDSNIFLLNYSEGTDGMVRQLQVATGLRISESSRQKMQSRSQFHAKQPKEEFEKEPVLTTIPACLNNAFVWYAQLEALRATSGVGKE